MKPQDSKNVKQKHKFTTEYAQFEFNSLQQVEKVSSDKKITNYLSQLQWIFPQTSFSNQIWTLYFSHMSSASCTALEINSCKNHSKMMIHIFMPKYKHLRTLNLSQNKIVSLEQVSFFDAPLLQTFQLDENQITNLKPFQKCRWIQFSILSLKQNPIRQSQFSRFMKKGKDNPSQLLKIESNANWMIELEKNSFGEIHLYHPDTFTTFYCNKIVDLMQKMNFDLLPIKPKTARWRRINYETEFIDVEFD